MKRIILAAILIAAVIGAYYFSQAGYFSQTAGQVVSAQRETATVVRVIDGDTVVLGDGSRVRLLNINTPERGQYLFRESTERLRQMVEGKEVALERDIEDKDKYGRSLRHIFVGGQFVNLILVREGYAVSLIIPPNEKHSQEVLEAEASAKESGLGVWQYAQDLFCIGIFNLHYNAKGDDNGNLNDEYVELRNSCTYPVEMTGWVLSDDDGNDYSFPAFILSAKSTVSIHSGPGVDSQVDIYWGKTNPVWGNSGDRLFMHNEKGELVLDYSY